MSYGWDRGPRKKQRPAGPRSAIPIYGPLLWSQSDRRPDRFLEFFAIFDRHHEGARPSDHAVLVIEIEILDIDRRIGWLLHHDRQAVDGDALLQGRVARTGYGGSVVVRPITGKYR